MQKFPLFLSVICAVALVAALPVRASASGAGQTRNAPGTLIQVRGIVMDTAGEPIMGAGVVETGATRNGTLTGPDGSFSLMITRGSSLEISCIGYETVTVTPVEGQPLSVALAEDAKLLDEVVVVGYGTQRKRLVTGSTVNVTGEKLSAVNAVDAFGEGRVSRWAAEGMMARVWLFYTGFFGKSELPLMGEDGQISGSVSKAQVVSWLEDCIQNSGFGLLPDQRNLWPYTNPYTAQDYAYDTDNNLEWATDENKEVMFAVKMGNGTAYKAPDIRYNRLPEYYGLRKTSGKAFPFNNQGYSNGPVCSTLWTDWGADPDYEGDYRRTGSICDRLVELPEYEGDKAKEVENTNYLGKKYVGAGAYDHANGDKLYQVYSYFYGGSSDHQLGLTQSLVWLRFADVLLMHAELTDGKAIYEGKSGLNAVRARAGLPDKSYSLDLLKKERRYELCCEAIRWNDLRRWGDVSQIVKNQVGNYILNEAATGTYAFTVDFMQRYTATGGGFFKIPESQITLSEGVLEQNPGWEDSSSDWAKGDLPYTFK